jgi:signal transduction histidine kinase
VSLARKLIAPQLVILALIAGLAAAQLFVASAESKQLGATAERLQRTGLRIQRLGQLFSDTERNLLSEFVTRSEILTRRIGRSNEEIDLLLEELSRSPTSLEGGLLLQDLVRMRGRLVESQRMVLQSSTQREFRSAFVRWWFLDQRANALLADVSADNLRGADRILAQVASSRSRSDRLMVTLTLLCVLTVAGMTVYVFRGVVGPLVRLTAASERLGEGGTVERLEGRTDELGTLSRVLARTTERLVDANAELQASIALRDRFISIAAHELRTPLTSLSLQVSLLKRRLEQSGQIAPLRPTVEALVRQSKRLDELVGELLDVTRIQAGRLELHTEPVRMDGLVREVCARCAPLLEAGANHLVLQVEDGVVSEVDPSRLDQVLVNLLGNAARHARNAPIEVRLWTTESETLLQVRDSGPGIPEAVRARLFQPFAREPGSTPGLGLGLYICREIVEAHRGRIEVETARGRGTAFTVHLPRAREIPAAALG